MHSDVVDLREFYLSPLGQAVRRLLRMRLRQIWPNLRGERVVALGYGVPLLRPFLGEAEILAAMMPAEQGVAYWPREGPNISCLADTKNLPLADNAVDRLILVHALEGESEPHLLLREAWRVLRNNGRMLLLVTNRRGFWAHSDRTPFGSGQPYSGFQIKDRLREHGFLVDRLWHALYMPPSSSRLLISLADGLEKYGQKLFPGFGGLLLVEAGKQLYAPVAAKSRVLPRRLVLPLPSPVGARPVPAGRSAR
jgi:SAM-dependent methyltransferase